MFHFVDSIRRYADEDVRSGELADDLGRCIILTDVDTVGTAGDGQIRRVIHDEGHVVVVADLRNGFSFFVLGAPFLMFFTVLDNRDASCNQFFGDIHIAAAQAEFFFAHDGIYRVF